MRNTASQEAGSSGQLVTDAGSLRPMVSVLLPTFNRATFLPGALEAIRSQTFGNWELIVVDDGSTDESREIVATFAASSPNPVRYV